MQDLQQLFGTPRPVALVTGSGAPRVGNAIVRMFAGRGFRVAVHANTSMDAANTTVEDLRSQGAEAIAVQAELTDEQAARGMIDHVRDHFGRLDVLVNSAAIWSPKKLEEVTAADVRRYLEVNTLSVFVCSQHAGLMMAGQPSGGAIVNLGDWAVVRPYADYSAYFPSKGAIPTLTRDLAVELAGRNPRIRVNAVLPGPVMLPENMPPEERAATIDRTLVKREGTARHVAHAVRLLVENDFITGVCLPVDGGRSIYAP